MSAFQSFVRLWLRLGGQQVTYGMGKSIVKVGIIFGISSYDEWASFRVG
jgi:hypothetical protein